MWAQEPGDWTVRLGARGTLYGIETRLDSGTILQGGVGYMLAPILMIEGELRRQSCFDCDHFMVVDAGLRLRRRGDRVSPFDSGGAGLSSDPGFMGKKVGSGRGRTWERLDPRSGSGVLPLTTARRHATFEVRVHSSLWTGDEVMA